MRWFRDHYLSFIRGLKHCLHDLTGQMGQGALALARECTTGITRAVFTAEAPPKPPASLPPSPSPPPKAAETATPSTSQPAPTAAASKKHTPVAQRGGRRGVATAKRGGSTAKRKCRTETESSNAEDVEMTEVALLPTPTETPPPSTASVEPVAQCEAEQHLQVSYFGVV